MTLNKRTTSTILAALRAYQRLLAVPVSDPQLVEAMDLASDSGTLTELSAKEIDAVCEDLNFDGARPRIRRAKHRRTADERCNSLSHAYGVCTAYVAQDLRDGEAPRTMARYRAFLRSLDGAIRNAQNVRERQS